MPSRIEYEMMALCCLGMSILLAEYAYGIPGVVFLGFIHYIGFCVSRNLEYVSFVGYYLHGNSLMSKKTPKPIEDYTFVDRCFGHVMIFIIPAFAQRHEVDIKSLEFYGQWACWIVILYSLYEHFASFFSYLIDKYGPR